MTTVVYSLRNLTLLVIWLVSSIFYNPTQCGSVQLTMANFDAMVATHEVVFLNFYADWCRFSQILGPVFDEAADKATAAVPEKGKALFGKVDCDAETALATRFHISKYPTLKVIRQGFVAKREYRGQRSADALAEFVKEQLQDPVKEMVALTDLDNVEAKKRTIVAYFDNKDVVYDTFRRVAMNLKEDCDFYVGTGPVFQDKWSGGNKIVYRPPFAKDGTKDQQYGGNLLDFTELNTWSTLRCIPLVREITFENAEELTEEGLPFLILFHHPDDHEIVEKYNGIVQKYLATEKSSVNFLTADGVKFAHPLHHLGKSTTDLPLIAIDSFRHMYLFPDIKDMTVDGKIKQFVDDLYSGKLHREFHYGPDPATEEKKNEDKQDKQDGGQDDNVVIQVNHGGVGGSGTSPPESTFRKLAPSRNRYTLLKDEL